MWYFCTRNSEGVHRNTGRHSGSNGKKFSKKKIGKSLRDLKMLFTFAPRIERLAGMKREKGIKISLKKLQKTFAS
jgi:hypothetical protein